MQTPQEIKEYLEAMLKQAKEVFDAANEAGDIGGICRSHGMLQGAIANAIIDLKYMRRIA